MTDKFNKVGINRYIDLRNLGLIEASIKGLKEILLLDEEIIKWEELNAIINSLRKWKEELNKRYLAEGKVNDELSLSNTN
jgi:hypothetical protein